MELKNQDLFPRADFFAVEQFKVIGEYAGQKVLLIGSAQNYGDPIVALSPTETPTPEDLKELVACDLYELMKCGTPQLNLTAAIFS